MGRGVSGGKGDNRTRQGGQRKTDVLVDGGGATRGKEPYESSASGRSTLGRLLAWFMDRHDGWLRLVPQGDGEAAFFKWKFNSGKWPNHYVMVRIEAWQIEYGLSLLQEKVERVDEGSIRPTPDHPF